MPRISAGSVPEHRALVQQRIFDAVASLLTQHSLESLSMAQIASEAGLGRTAIYHHFPDKEAIVVEFAMSETSAYLETLAAALEGVTDPLERLRGYVDHHRSAGQQFNIGLGQRIASSLSRDAAMKIREHVVAVEKVLADTLSDARADGTVTFDDERTAISLIHACLGNERLELESVWDFILGALTAPR